MAVVESRMTELGSDAPEFDLPVVNPDVDEIPGETRSLMDYANVDVLVVVFTCNHCPYAQDIEPRLNDLAREYQEKGVVFVAINPNDAKQYPDDSFENMAKRAEEHDYPYVYLQDASQEVAQAYGAECTPDIFVYDSERKLAYRGRLDDGRPGKEATTHDLKDALDQLLETGDVTIKQIPSMGCNIKWKS